MAQRYKRPGYSLAAAARSRFLTQEESPMGFIAQAVLAILVLSVSANLSGTVPPVANIGGPYTASEGSSITFDASGSTDDGLIVGYTWDFGDGSPPVSSTLPTTLHLYNDDGAYAVMLTVEDDDGMTDSAVVVNVITNVAPSVNAGPDQSVGSGGTASVAATVSDPGALDTHVATIDWDDGTVEPAAVSGGMVIGSHVYASNGTYTVSVCVSDDDGGVGCDTLEISVGAVPVRPTSWSAIKDLYR